MKNKLSLIAAPAVIFCWCFFSLQGCKQPIIEDNRLLTSDDDLNLSKDTLHLKVFSQFEQPLSSNGVSNGVLGSINDPNFGNTYAGFYAQCQLTTGNVYFGENPILDSAVLTLAYNGTYGKFTQPVTVSVYELAQSINDSTTYKTNQAFAVNTTPLGQVSGFVPNSTDSIVALNGVLPPHLRIKLSDALGTKILTADTNLLVDNSAFLNLFKGFYVTTTASLTGNGAVYINLASSYSAITLFYHNDVSDSLYYTLPISGVTVNHFDNIYTGTPVYNSVNMPNTNGEQKIYVQGGAGVYGKILINDLDSLPKNIAVNKAELIISQSAEVNDTQYLAPLILNLFRIDDAAQGQTIEDDALASIGGLRIAETVNGNIITRYRFNIKKYFQKLLQGVYHNNGFYLKAFVANSNSERVVIANSPTDKNYQVTLVVTYTKL